MCVTSLHSREYEQLHVNRNISAIFILIHQVNSRVSFVFFRIITTINWILCDYKKLPCSLTYSLNWCPDLFWMGKLACWWSYRLNCVHEDNMDCMDISSCPWSHHGRSLTVPADDQQLAGDWWWNMKQTADSKRRHLLIGDPPSFSQRLLIVDVDRIDADEPEWHTEITSWYLTQLYLDFLKISWRFFRFCTCCWTKEERLRL